MSIKKLYAVEVRKTLYVVALNHLDAAMIAEDSRRDEEDWDCDAVELTSLDGLPVDITNSLPWGVTGNNTVAEHFREMQAAARAEAEAEAAADKVARLQTKLPIEDKP